MQGDRWVLITLTGSWLQQFSHDAPLSLLSPLGLAASERDVSHGLQLDSILPARGLVEPLASSPWLQPCLKRESKATAHSDPGRGFLGRGPSSLWEGLLPLWFSLHEPLRVPGSSLFLLE